MFSVSGSSWLGQWRREVLVENMGDEALAVQILGTRPLYSIEAAEYGGTNARNVAAILMDFSGKQQHPKITLPPLRRDINARLVRLIHRPSALINPKPLRGKTLAALSKAYDELPNQQRTELLASWVENLLEDCLEDINHLSSLLEGESDEALAFQNLFDDITMPHAYLLFAKGSTSDEQIKAIGSDITNKWLGAFNEFKAGGERYNKIKALVIEQLHDYMASFATDSGVTP